MILNRNTGQPDQNENGGLILFGYRLRNFFRPAAAARDIPPGARWAFPHGVDPIDPYTDPDWLEWWRRQAMRRIAA